MVGCARVRNITRMDELTKNIYITMEQNRSTEGCSKLKRSVDMTSSGKTLNATMANHR